MEAVHQTDEQVIHMMVLRNKLTGEVVSCRDVFIRKFKGQSLCTEATCIDGRSICISKQDFDDEYEVLFKVKQKPLHRKLSAHIAMEIVVTGSQNQFCSPHCPYLNIQLVGADKDDLTNCVLFKHSVHRKCNKYIRCKPCIEKFGSLE